MIILPDRNVARSKYLPPMHRRIWQRAWQGDARIHFQSWIAQLYRADHSMVWQGHFEDREDADEFMAALGSGIIKQDGYLRRLPTWCPDFDPDLLRDPSIAYNMVSNIGIGPSSGNWSAPGDCWGLKGRAGEFADVIGPGGGGAGTPAFYTASGGGGGGFARLVNMSISGGAAVPYSVGSGGGGGTNGNGGGGSGNTWLKAQDNGGNGVCSSAGGGGTLDGSAGRPGGGGGGGGIAGNFGYAGGRGGNVVEDTGNSGGGGAAGPNGNGLNGGDGGINGGGGASNANVTGNIYGPWGPGNGGAGAEGNPAQGGAGAHYGGGGGSGVNNFSTVGVGRGGAGGAGLIVIRYEPTYQHTVTGISPGSGPTAGGQAVVISGTNFVGVTQADIGGSVLTGMSHNTTQIFGTTAAGGAGSYNVNVYTNQGPGVASWYGYTFVSPPSMSSASPSSGPTNVETLVAITGANMAGVSSVTFGGSPVVTGIDSSRADLLYCWAPVHAAGLVSVVITNSYGSASASIFTYVTPPSLSGCNPVRGLTHGGTNVTLTGADLSGTTSVTFGGTAATNLVVVNATTITCRTPAHTRGLVNVVATNGYGAATLVGGFDYLLPASGFNMPMGI